MGHSATLNNRYTTDLAIVIDAIQNSAPHFFHIAGLTLTSKQTNIRYGVDLTQIHYISYIAGHQQGACSCT